MGYKLPIAVGKAITEIDTIIDRVNSTGLAAITTHQDFGSGIVDIVARLKNPYAVAACLPASICNCFEGEAAHS